MTTVPPVDEPTLIELTKQLIRTPSLSGSEQAIGKIIVRAMNESGFDRVETDEEHNVLGILEGDSFGPSILFLAHSDLGAWKFGIDIFALEDVGIPCAGIGPGKESYAHTPYDHVAVDDLVAASKIYAVAALDVCRK
jgi:acetylornithine deacetylase/succinyl-diaminopimelate desuccinylase-like protein